MGNVIPLKSRFKHPSFHHLPFQVLYHLSWAAKFGCGKEGQLTPDEPCAKEVRVRVTPCGKAAEEPVGLLGSYDPWGRGMLGHSIVTETGLAIRGKLVGC